jgi:hypothetical protein
MTLRLGLARVVEDDLDLVGAFDHVVVGQDVAAGADDHAAAQAALRFVGALVAEEKLEPRVFGVRVFGGGLAGVDADDGRGSDLGGRGKTAPAHPRCAVRCRPALRSRTRPACCRGPATAA